jgi:hypothetical protein
MCTEFISDFSGSFFVSDSYALIFSPWIYAFRPWKTIRLLLWEERDQLVARKPPVVLKVGALFRLQPREQTQDPFSPRAL